MKYLLSYQDYAKSIPKLLSDHVFDIIDLGIDSSENDLAAARKRGINIAYIISILVSFSMTILRLFKGEFELILINLGVCILLFFSFLFCHYGKHQMALSFICIYVLVLSITLFNSGQEIAAILYLGMTPTLVTFLSKRKSFFYVYFLLCMFLFTYLFYQKVSDVIVFYVIAFICSFVATSFINVLINQYGKLQKVIRLRDEALLARDAAIMALKDKNQEMMLFSSVMSHDLKAPLRSIKGFSALIERNNHLDQVEERLEYLDYIEKAADSMNALISDILIYSKTSYETFSFREIELDDLVQKQKLAFHFDILNHKLKIASRPLPSIQAHESSLQIVFQNLISNAIKYQPKNKEGHIPQIEISYKSEADKEVILFADNGIGICTEYLPKLFEPFRRFHSAADYEGTGLGMSICKRIMLKHGGDIKIAHTNENGTCFALEFPKA